MIEEKLRDLIIDRYGSIRNFSQKIDMPNSTIDSILKRGIQNSNINNIIKICKKLDIDLEQLVINEKIVEKDYTNHINETIETNDKKIDVFHDQNVELDDDMKNAIINFVEEHIKNNK